MYHNSNEFLKEWHMEMALTQLVMDALTDESLNQTYSENTTRDLGKLAWHIAAGIPEFLANFGIEIERIHDVNTVPATAKEITDAFKRNASLAASVIPQQTSDDYWGQLRMTFGREMTNGETLGLLIKHTIHHRGQMTVLMRQAGIKPPGVYGPVLEDWEAIMKCPPPKV